MGPSIVRTMARSLRDRFGQHLPRRFDRDRPLHWNVLSYIAPNSKYGIGNEWKAAELDDGRLRCETCGYRGEDRAVMIVNDPFDPHEPVQFDSPTQVLCAGCVRRIVNEEPDTVENDPIDSYDGPTAEEWLAEHETDGSDPNETTESGSDYDRFNRPGL